MAVAVPVTTPAVTAPQLPTLWELGTDLQAETIWIARLAEHLDSEDDDLVAITTTRTPDKVSIKARIRAAIAAAIHGLPRSEAAHLAVSIAATAVPGARLTQRRHWSIT